MKLNLGSGTDIKEGYTNVDIVGPCDVKHDLTSFPWPFEDESCDEILMLDFLEHIPYRMTELVLQEAWRVMRVNGRIEIQVPDFEHCAFAIMNMENTTFKCNVCGFVMENEDDEFVCPTCGSTMSSIRTAAMRRLYGGQDYPGNWHFFAFTKSSLEEALAKIGFHKFEYLEQIHQHANWNFKISAMRLKDAW